MLTRRRLAATGVGVLVLASLTVAFSAFADGGVYCPPLGGPCTVVAGTGGSGGNGGGNGGGGGGGGTYDDRLGWLNSDGCYYRQAEPQPPKSDEAWGGHTDGAVYVKSCLHMNGPLGVPLWVGQMVWSATPPPGGGLPDPAVLAAQAINSLGIEGPAIGTAPNFGGAGLVGLPVWLWTDTGPTRWGPVSATAAVPGLSVTATATADHIVWDMGDGHSVTCANPGTPYTGHGYASPSCGYVYFVPSGSASPRGKYNVTATTTWNVHWEGGGAQGDLTVTRASATEIEIDELQVVTS